MSATDVAPRHDGRADDQLRPTCILPAWLSLPLASVLVQQGRTWVSCTVAVETGVPRFVRGRGRGWLTASYALAPAATTERRERERRGAGGRTLEIERLVARSLRSAVDLRRLGDRTLHVDCDVLQADGGTRTASITGGWVAVALAVRALLAEGVLESDVLVRQVAAVGVGMVEGRALLDMDYHEDLHADTDMNVVVTDGGGLVEVQGAAEGQPFSPEELSRMLDLAVAGGTALLAAQREALDGP